MKKSFESPLAFIASEVCEPALDASTVRMFQFVHHLLQSPAMLIARAGSISVLAICDHRMAFRYCVVGAPDCVHDARVWRESSLFRALLTKVTDKLYYILGDPAYANLHFCLTPFDAEPTRRHANYNFAHSSTHITIERTFVKFKSQWRLFSTTLPHYYPNELGKFLQAAFVLHNVTITDVDEYEDDPHRSSVGLIRAKFDTSSLSSNFSLIPR